MNDTGMKMFDKIIVSPVMVFQSDKIWDEIWMDAPKLLFIFLLVEYKHTHFPEPPWTWRLQTPHSLLDLNPSNDHTVAIFLPWHNY